MKPDNMLDQPVENAADIETLEAQILRKMGRRRKKRRKAVAHALALLWIKPEKSSHLE